MAKQSNQKQKLLYLVKLFQEQTDENHPVTMAEILSYLHSKDISAERKSIYTDLDVLRDFGYEILHSAEGYWLGSREFELPELKLLADSVLSSKFITRRKTLSLIRKIEGLTSVHNAKALHRQVYVCGQVKTMNESIYYHVDEIAGAIDRNHAIRFRYFSYTAAKERVYHRDGALYEVSPHALLWDNENYYLLGWDHDDRKIKHFRVDKMERITQTSSPRQGSEAFAKVDLSVYTKKYFGMFSGQEQSVQLRFSNRLAGVVLDRFGLDSILAPDGPEHFTVTVNVAVSPQFFAWLFGFGAEAELLYPASVREAFVTQTKAVLAEYS